ncbi:MAG: radical SAM protein [Methanomassiliicoccus sp.]|nr:radical SAM protein [Methanomassiliicoccus sp.]
MKVMLTTPPWKTTEKWPPLGLLYLAGSVRKERGDEVVVVDAFCHNLTVEELVDRVVRERPDVLGMNCSTHTFTATMEVMSRAHQLLPDLTIVLGGYHATFAAREILNEYWFIDFIIKGEAERSLPRLLDHIEAETEPTDVEGISFVRSDGTLFERPLTLVQDLDALDFPDRSLLGDFEYGYMFQGVPLTFGRFTTISTSRGCPFSCTYCSCAAFSERRWRPRGAKSVVDELEMLYKQGYRECVMVDDNFTQSVERVEDICRQIKERNIRMRLYCEGRAGHAQLSLLKQMKSAGFNVIYFGAESSSPNVLEYYNKKQTPERTAEAVANAKRAGMLVITSYILGAPIESREEMKSTIQFAQSLRPHGVQYNILDFLVGTPLWEQMKSNGVVRVEDWKTNHRVYEYFPEHASREELEALVNDGYGSFLGAWKSGSGVLELLRTMMVNSTARRVVLGNITNPAARRMITDGLKGF